VWEVIFQETECKRRTERKSLGSEPTPIESRQADKTGTGQHEGTRLRSRRCIHDPGSRKRRGSFVAIRAWVVGGLDLPAARTLSFCRTWPSHSRVVDLKNLRKTSRSMASSESLSGCVVDSL
jgi:hypothetical protein